MTKNCVTDCRYKKHYRKFKKCESNCSCGRHKSREPTKGMTGKKHTEIAKAKMKEQWTDQRRQDSSRRQTGQWTEEKRRKHAEACRRNTSGYLTHGLSKHEHYARWYNMNYRCNNPNDPGYRNYGGRGITVCDDWHQNNPSGCQNFITYVEENLAPLPEGYSLDRIDNDGNYEPGNIQWASQSEQNRNQRLYNYL